MMALMIVNVDGLKLGGQLDRETSLVAFSYIVYFVHCAFSMLSENKFYLLTMGVKGSPDIAERSSVEFTTEVSRVNPVPS